MSWNYRVTRHLVPVPGQEPAHLYEIREVYYDEAGVPTSWTEDPISPMGETKEELSNHLVMLCTAITKTVFDLDTRTNVASP